MLYEFDGSRIFSWDSSPKIDCRRSQSSSRLQSVVNYFPLILGLNLRLGQIFDEYGISLQFLFIINVEQKYLFVFSELGYFIPVII